METMKKDRNRHLVIMAGGVGSRFWPASSPEYPKQFLDVLGCGKTLLQLTYQRFVNVVPLENIWVVTSERYKNIVIEQLPEMQPDHVVAEPCARGTAPCIAYISWKIKKINPKANLVITPSDHIVTDVLAFEGVVNNAMEFSAETDSVVTLGIKPTRPETGYGYIEADLSSSSSRLKNIFRVDSFKEKPNKVLAEKYISQKNYFWNSGIFIWSVSTIVNAFRVYSPRISEIFEGLLPFYNTPEEKQYIEEYFPKCPNVSVDTEIMEKAEEIFVCPSDFGWSDLGTWSSLALQMKPDQYGNACAGQQIGLFESHNCMVHTPNMKKVLILGLDGYVVAENNGELLICKLSEEQRIKTFLATMDESEK